MIDGLEDEIRIPTDRITRAPAVMVGKPVVKGTRIPVDLVLEHLSGNLNLEDLFAAYPHLTVDDVKAVPAYAREAVLNENGRGRHRAALNARLRSGEIGPG